MISALLILILGVAVFPLAALVFKTIYPDINNERDANEKE